MGKFLAAVGIAILTAYLSLPAGNAAEPAIPESVPIAATAGMLVNSVGMTLYTFDLDVAGSGKSKCNSDCATMWPPMLAGDDKPAGNFTIITRDGGERQWAYKGKPLYLFSGDVNPDDTTGDGVNGVWHIARP
jgi:predicted lipoprotein with Yx(FWY)xxD motif